MENMKTHNIAPPLDWDPSWDGNWEDSEQYKLLVAEQVAVNENLANHPEERLLESSKEEEPPVLQIEDGDVVVEIPMHRIRHLLDREEVVTVKVHGKPILVSKNSLCEIAGGVPFDRINMRSVQESLEENISLQEVEEFRRIQTRSVSLGTEYYLAEGVPVLDTNQFKVKTPSLASKLRVELADQDFDLDGFELLNGVKPEFKDVARGLNKVIRTPIAAHILNMVQEQEPKQEMAFYAMIFEKLEAEANTFTLALGMMRHLMQYALNVDSLQLRSILTDELVNGGNIE